jgi:hypothetical protein
VKALEVARRFFDELWNERRLDVADEIIAPHCVTHQLKSAPGPMSSASRGPGPLKEHIRVWLTAFPDLRWEIDASMEQDDRALCWVTARATHRGEWQGILPTQRPVVLRCAVMHRVERGQIVEDWVLTDALGLYQQLDVVADTATLIRRAGPAR